jgi:hypothetical protein
MYSPGSAELCSTSRGAALAVLASKQSVEIENHG